MPPSLTGDVTPVKRAIAPPWEKPPVSSQWEMFGGTMKEQRCIPSTILLEAMPWSISALIRELK